MDDKIVPPARDQVVATFPGAGIELLTVAGSDICERNPVIGFVVTRNVTYPVTGTMGMGCRRGGHVTLCHPRKAWERIAKEYALLHPDGKVEAADGCMYQSLSEYKEIRKSAEWAKEESLRMEKRRAAYQKAKARRKMRPRSYRDAVECQRKPKAKPKPKHLKLVTEEKDG